MSGEDPASPDPRWPDRIPMGMFEWIDALGRVRVKDFGVAPKTVKEVGWRMALFGDPDGSRVMPGLAKLAVLCQADYKTVKTVVSKLESAGFLGRISRGSGPQGARAHHANCYQLTVPLDLLDRFEVLSPADLEVEAERVREANRRVTGKNSPRKDGGLRGNPDPVTQEEDQQVTGKNSPRNPELRGKTEQSYGEIPSAIPTKNLPPTTTNPPQLNVCADLTVSPARGKANIENCSVGVIAEQDPPPRPCPTGIGICVTCSAMGQFVIAANSATGSHCATHGGKP